MQCSNCGKELTSEDKFCNSCGTPVAPAFEVPLVSQETANVLRPVTEAPSAEVAQVVEAAPVEETAPAPEVQPVVETAPVQEAAPVQPAAESILVAPTSPIVEAAPVQEAQPVHIDVQSHFDNNNGVYDSTPGVDVQETTRLNDTTLNSATSNDSGVVSIPLGNNNLDTEKIDVSANYGPAPIVDPPAEALQYNNPAVVKPKKGFPIPALIAIIVVLSLFFGAGGLFVGSKLLATKQTTPTEQQDPEGPVFIAEYSTVTFQGNRFDIPLEYDYDIKDDKLSIYTKDIYYYVQIVGSGYAGYSANIPYVKQSYEKIGYKVSEAKEIEVGNTKYIILKLVTPKKENVTMFIRPHTANQSFVCAVGKADRSFATTKDLDTIETILSSAQMAATKDFDLEEDQETDELFKVIFDTKLPETTEEVE